MESNGPGSSYCPRNGASESFSIVIITFNNTLRMKWFPSGTLSLYRKLGVAFPDSAWSTSLSFYWFLRSSAQTMSPRIFNWYRRAPQTSMQGLLLCQVLNWWLDDSPPPISYFIKMESSEETPLLPSAKNIDQEIYKRFSLPRKRGILAIVSLIGLIPRPYTQHISSWVREYWAND